jgi:hypothetical protein
MLVFPERFNAVMIASDGRPLPKSFQSDSLVLYPGERYQVLIKNQEVGFDSIKVHYFNLNTRKTASTQYLSFITDQSAVLDPLPESGQLSLYPNPSDGSLSIKSVGNEEIREVEIYDNTGNLLFSDILSISQISYSNTELSFPAGIYIVKVRLKSGVIVFRWVVL